MGNGVRQHDGQFRFHGGSLGYKGAGAPVALNRSGYLNSYASEVETLQENQLCEQLGRTRFPTAGGVGQAPKMSGGGELDEALLELGGAPDLPWHLAKAFEREPPNEAGRQPHASGTFHGFNPGSYARRVFSADAVCRTLRLAHDLWGSAPNMMRLTIPQDGRVIIVGDTHGQLEDVLWLFFKYGLPSSQNQYLFNGDIVDRGGHALEILLMLLAFKRDDPSCVHIIRGNHEDQMACTTFGFKAEIDSKFGLEGPGGWIFHLLTTQLFPLLPLGAVVADAAGGFPLVVLHGGVPVRCPGLDGVVTLDGHLSRLDRRQVTVQKHVLQRSVDDHVLFNLLWADPAGPGEVPAADPGQGGGRGNAFTEHETADFCNANRMRMVVRSHQVPKAGRGFEYHHHGKCVTVFSASNYCGSQGNKGAVLLCGGSSFPQQGPRPSEHLAPGWAALAAIVAQHGFNKHEAERLRIAAAVEAGGAAAVAPAVAQAPGPAPAPQPGLSALQQIEQFVAEQIVLHKRALFVELGGRDPQHRGSMPLVLWQHGMTKVLPNVPPVWQDLARAWELPEFVPYVQFLHRFQIGAQIVPNSSATHTDVFHAMGQLRIVISDVAAHELLSSLDGDLNGSVSLPEFQDFLQAWQIAIPAWQAAALYEGLVWSLNNEPRVEDVLLAVALISRGEEDDSGGSSEWAEVAKSVGETISRASKGGSLVGLFRACDVDRDGFLSVEELTAKLGKMLPKMTGRAFSEEELRSLVSHMDSQGVANGRVSLVEFLRALGPRSLAKELAGSLLREVLKPIYFYRTMLETYFQRFDPASHNVVSLEQFERGLQEMNRQLVADGGTELSDYQLKAVVEIASGGHPHIQYRAFLRSLRVVDTVKRAKLVTLGQQGLRSFFSGVTA